MSAIIRPGCTGSPFFSVERERHLRRLVGIVESEEANIDPQIRPQPLRRIDHDRSRLISIFDTSTKRAQGDCDDQRSGRRAGLHQNAILAEKSAAALPSATRKVAVRVPLAGKMTVGSSGSRRWAESQASPSPSPLSAASRRMSPSVSPAVRFRGSLGMKW